MVTEYQLAAFVYATWVLEPSKLTTFLQFLMSQKFLPQYMADRLMEAVELSERGDDSWARVEF